MAQLVKRLACYHEDLSPVDTQPPHNGGTLMKDPRGFLANLVLLNQ